MAAGVDELVVTEVDPGVTDTTATTIGGEEQPKITQLDGGDELVLWRSRTRLTTSAHVLDGRRVLPTGHITDETAAIEPSPEVPPKR